jgi:hypothetical protein
MFGTSRRPGSLSSIRSDYGAALPLTRWATAIATLVGLQEEYRAWLDNLPPNLENSALADKLQTVVEFDLEALQGINPPHGYGRD